MARFFVLPEQIDGNLIYIKGEDVAHISRVLRMQPGDDISVCDGMGKDYICQLAKIDKTSVVAEIITVQENDAEPLSKITLYQGIPKGSKFDFIVQKCVEIGVTKIVPMQTERVVSKGALKIDRLSKISMEAAKQSGRGIVPLVCETISFDEAVSKASADDIALIPYECERENTLKAVLKNATATNISVFIGPEGGFSDHEISLALEHGIHSVTLGNRILRTETAGLVTIGNILYELEG